MERMKKKCLLCALLVFAMAVAGGCAFAGAGGSGSVSGGAAEGKKKTRELFAMDTIMELTLYDGVEGAMEEAVAFIQRMDRLFSVTDAESDIAKINRAEGRAVTVSDETYELLQICLSEYEETEGLFDISVYPLVKKWGFTTENPHVPAEEEIAAALKKIDASKIRLKGENQVQAEPGMEIDLGAVAKGYVSQKLMELFRERGVSSAIVSLGGNVQTIGEKEDGSPFCVGITDPADGTGVYGTVDIKNKAVITSGIYQRYFTAEDGTEYHHIMDKRTGSPAENGLASVTVISDDGPRADALATALFVMGEERAVEFQKEHPDIELILIRRDGSYWQSGGAGMKIR